MRYLKWFVPVIIILLVAIFAPIIITGYAALKQAETARAEKDYGSAAKFYERAARLLIWRKDLWEKAGIAASVGDNPANAILDLERAPELSEEGWLALGYCYYQIGDLKSAQTAFQNGATFYSSSSAYAGLAQIYQRQKNWNAERAALENQLRLDAGNAYAHYRLGVVLTALEPERALSELMLAASLNPEADSVVQTLRVALNLFAAQPDLSQRQVTVGRALGLAQEWDLAIVVFEKAVALNAKNAEAWAWLGEAKQQTGQDGRAELDQAVALEPASAVVRALRGLYWNRRQKYAQALAEYSLAAKYEPKNPAWQASLGDAYVKNGDLVAALSAYQRATELAPNVAAYWRLLAIFCMENNARVEDIGLPAAQKAVELAPDDPLALDALGWAYLSSSRYASAEKTLQAAVARSPKLMSAHIHLALTYFAQGRRAAAFDQLTYVRDADAGGANGLLAEQLLAKYFP